MRILWMTAVLGCFLLGLMAVSAHAEGKVGFINLNRLVNESEMGQTLKEELAFMQTEKQALVTAKRKQVEDLKAYLQSEGDQLTDTEKTERINTLKQMDKEYQRLVADANEDLNREKRELVAMVLKEADGVLKKVARDNHYTLIIKDRNAVGYLDPRVDITDLVLEALNRSN